MNAPSQLLTPKQIESWIPTFDEICGNFEIREILASIKRGWPCGIPNMLFRGEPGTGKTSIAMSIIRFATGLKAFSDNDAAGIWTALNGYRFWYLRIDGGSISEAWLRQKVEVARECNVDHCYVLIDELGELYFRGLDETLRGLLDCEHITTIATAQNFHSKRRTDSDYESNDRLKALGRRFRLRPQTELPSQKELALWLAARTKQWAIPVESPKCLLRLAQKSACVPGFALGGLAFAAGRPDRRLTLELVERYEPDPSLNL